MNHQDFKQVVFTKGGNRPGGIGPGSYKGLSNEKKALLYDFEETPTVKRFGSENGKIVQAARLAKQLTQDQLAHHINERKQVVNQYEQGNVVPDQKIVAKLRRCLNVKFV
jgi:putative transcription factor